RVGDVELGVPERPRHGGGRGLDAQGAPELTACARQQDSQGKVSTSASGGAAASLADRRGRTPGGSGHSMPSAGSFQASERSASRDQKSVTWYCTRVPGASERKPCAKPGGTHSDRALAASSVSARLRPKDRKSTRLNSSHSQISYAVFCLKKKKK